MDDQIFSDPEVQIFRKLRKIVPYKRALKYAKDSGLSVEESRAEVLKALGLDESYLLKRNDSAKKDRQFFESKQFSQDFTSNSLEWFDWIYHNLFITDIKPKDAPAPGAFFHLIWIRESESRISDFLKTYTTRRMPQKSQLDEMIERLTDDGRDLKNFMSELLVLNDRAKSQKLSGGGRR